MIDYYQRLEVSKDATLDEITKSYRRLAQKYHPDKNKSSHATERFKAINAAFNVLRNKEEREKYDRELEMEDASDITEDIFISLEDISTGSVKKMTIERRNYKTEKYENKTFFVQIDKGWKAGTKITYPGDGHQCTKKDNGNVVFFVREMNHPLFKRENNNLHYTYSIPLVDALCGKKNAIIPTLKGGMETLDLSDDIVTPETVKRLPGYGLPNKKGLIGDMIVHFNCTYPKDFDLKTKDKLKRLLTNESSIHKI